MSGGTSAATLATVAIGATAGVSAYGQIQQGQAQAQAARYQAQVAQNNAIIANQNATYEQEKGTEQEQQERQKTAAFIGSQTAQQAANGLDVDSGSNLDLRASSATLGEEDALTIRSNTAHNVASYEQQASNDTSQASLDEFNASNSELAGFISGAGSIVGGASSVSGQAANFSLKGINILS